MLLFFCGLRTVETIRGKSINQPGPIFQVDLYMYYSSRIVLTGRTFVIRFVSCNPDKNNKTFRYGHKKREPVRKILSTPLFPSTAKPYNYKLVQAKKMDQFSLRTYSSYSNSNLNLCFDSSCARPWKSSCICLLGAFSARFKYNLKALFSRFIATINASS